MIDNTDPRPEIGNITADRGGWADFANVADRLVTVWHVETARAVQVFPLRLVFAVAVEHLDAMVLAVGDIDPAVGVGDDVVDDVELAGIGAGFTPTFNQLAVGRVLMHASIAVAVGDVDLALRRQRGVGAAV